jgi:glycosyltransferase involved in cell wall biosynthesis
VALVAHGVLSVRICLLTGGGYPYRRDALGGWCRTVVEGLIDVEFDLLTVTDREPPTAPAYPLSRNVASVRAAALGRETPGRDDRRRNASDEAEAAAVLLCRGLLGEQDNADAMVADGLRRLAELGAAASPSPAGADRVGAMDPRERGRAGAGPLSSGFLSTGLAGSRSVSITPAGTTSADEGLAGAGFAGNDLAGGGRRADGGVPGSGPPGGGLPAGGWPDSGLDRSGPAWSGLDRSGPAWSGLDRSGPAWSGLNRSGEPAGGPAGSGLFGSGPARSGMPGHRQPANPPVGDALAGVALADVLQDAWRAGRSARSGDRLPLPRLSVRDARTAAALLRHAARALAVQPPAADLVHCVGGTTPLLAALAGHWRTGTPLLLTEARAPVARLRPAEERLSPAVRTVLRRFRRAVARTGYAEAELIAPLSAYHHAWALRHGARPGRLVSVPAGVDPADYATAPEPAVAEPAVVWAGSGGPDSGLTPLLEAFGSIVAHVPGTVLHLVGVTAAHEDHCAEQIERTGLGRAVRLHPLPADPRDRYAAGHVVVHVPGPADPPYRLIEAMMSGRAVVGVDVGPAAETLGDAGVLVPGDDPAALAAACIALLRSPARRRALGDAARRRALACFTTDRVVRVYGALYTDLAAPPPAPAYELALSVPAPRTELPSTMRWLIREDR